MKTARCSIFLMLLAGCSTALAQSVVFEGPWHTTNRKLDGTMTCAVTKLGNELWRGHFYGTWQGVGFDFTETFSGPLSKLHGTAIIDGADYDWTGAIKQDPPGSFRGAFGGSRYEGYFDLQEKSKSTSIEKPVSVN